MPLRTAIFHFGDVENGDSKSTPKVRPGGNTSRPSGWTLGGDSSICGHAPG